MKGKLPTFTKLLVCETLRLSFDSFCILPFVVDFYESQTYVHFKHLGNFILFFEHLYLSHQIFSRTRNESD